MGLVASVGGREIPMILLRRILSLATFAALVAAAHGQVTVYNNDFSGGAGSEWSIATTKTSNGQTYLSDPNGYYGFGALTDTLTLTGLQAHSSVTLSFDLYMIGSQDGNGPAGGGPDPWTLSQNGNSLIATNFANYTGGGNSQDFGGPNGTGGYLTGGSYTNRTGSDTALGGQLGYGTGDYGDSTYHFAFTFAGTSPTQTFAFTSGENEGNGNEGWGLDNVRVTIVPTATPEPASFAAVGLGVLAFLRRRRKA